MAVIGDLDTMLRRLEAEIRLYVPQCAFYFGEREEMLRQKSPPFVAWQVQGGVTSDETRETAGKLQVSWRDDDVEIIARCAGFVPPDTHSEDLRRQQLQASLLVFWAVSYAVEKFHQGYCTSDGGWETVNPEELSDAYYPVDYTFRIRAGRRTPPIVDVQPEEAPASVVLE